MICMLRSTPSVRTRLHKHVTRPSDHRIDVRSGLPQADGRSLQRKVKASPIFAVNTCLAQVVSLRVLLSNPNPPQDLLRSRCVKTGTLEG